MRTLLIVAVVVLAVTPSAAALNRQLEVFLHEVEGGLHLLPENMEANVGDTLQVTVTNLGESPHNLLFCGDPASTRESCKDRWAFTPNIAPNATATLSVPLRKGGTFDYWCALPGHKQLGMTGTLTVTGDSSDLKQDSPGLAVLGSLAALGAVALLLRRQA